MLDLQRALHADPATSGGRGTFGSDTLDLSDIAGKVSWKNRAFSNRLSVFFHFHRAPTCQLLIASVCLSHQNKSADKFKRPFKKRHSSVYHQPSNRVNKYLAQAIEARSVDREKADHVTLTTLCFRDHNKESQVGLFAWLLNFGAICGSVFCLKGYTKTLLVWSSSFFFFYCRRHFANWIRLKVPKVALIDCARHKILIMKIQSCFEFGHKIIILNGKVSNFQYLHLYYIQVIDI